MATTERDLLKGLTQNQAAEVLALGRRQTVATGTELFGLGTPADCVYIIERGRIALTLPMQVRGREEDVMVEERQSGETVGWSALIPPHNFTLKATAPLDTDVLAIPRVALYEHFAAHPDVGYCVAQNVAAIVGQRLQVFQTMWLREMQRVIELRCA